MASIFASTNSRLFADINHSLRVFKEVTCGNADNGFVSAYDTHINKFLKPCYRGCTCRFDTYAFKPCKVFLGCKDFFVSNRLCSPAGFPDCS